MGKYSKIAILFHWAIALLIGANILLANLAEDLPKAARGLYEPAQGHWHFHFGADYRPDFMAP